LDKVTRRFLVLGKVQGVYFRHSSRLEASRRNLRGYARNLPDGSVEVLAHGPADLVEELHGWLKHGPAHARVDEVRETASDVSVPLPEAFITL
jgi:acylphosphatase